MNKHEAAAVLHNRRVVSILQALNANNVVWNLTSGYTEDLITTNCQNPHFIKAALVKAGVPPKVPAPGKTPDTHGWKEYFDVDLILSSICGVERACIVVPYE